MQKEKYRLVHTNCFGRDVILNESHNIDEVRRDALDILKLYNKYLGDYEVLEVGRQWNLPLPPCDITSYFCGLLTINTIYSTLDKDSPSIWNCS